MERYEVLVAFADEGQGAFSYGLDAEGLRDALARAAGFSGRADVREVAVVVSDAGIIRTVLWKDGVAVSPEAVAALAEEAAPPAPQPRARLSALAERELARSVASASLTG